GNRHLPIASFSANLVVRLPFSEIPDMISTVNSKASGYSPPYDYGNETRNSYENEPIYLASFFHQPNRQRETHPATNITSRKRTDIA
ncbi:hypothetical protein TNIN_190681, partial [Trichonephila inaurata madagascariensis]